MLLNAVVNISTATTTEIIAAVAGRKIVIVGYNLHAAADQTVIFKRGSTALSGEMQLIKGTCCNPGGVAPYTEGYGQQGWFETIQNEAFNITTSTTGLLGGHITYLLI